jgi:hypothetical protein
MAKRTRTERATEALNTAWTNERDVHRHRGYSRKGLKRQRHEQDRLWNGLLRAANRHGVRVFLMTQTEREADHTYRDGSGSFQAGGFFRSPSTIKLAYRSVSVLAHELAHALDYQLGDGYRGSEVIATSVEVLVCGTATGSFTTNTAYAKRQLGSAAQYEAEQERIQVIYETIMDALAST